MKKWQITFCGVLMALTAWGQLPPIPNTPNAFSMTRFEAQKPNLYTGTATVQIPLYTINFDGWELPLTLSYHAAGIRTNQDATEVGLGWALNATGVITRNILKYDDLISNADGLSLTGYIYDSQPVTSSIFLNSPYYNRLRTGLVDTEPDIFNYSFFGYSGSFVLDKKSNGSIPVKKLEQNACRITFNEDNKTFTILTPRGFRGDFTVKERSTNFYGATDAPEFLDACRTGLIDIMEMINRGRFRPTTSWYLSRITSPNGEVIDFTYDRDANGNSKYISVSSPSSAEHRDPVYSCVQVVHEHTYLTGIHSDEVAVVFSMENREDLKVNDLFMGRFPNSGSKLKRYTTMTISGLDPASTLNKRVDFYQTYFNPGYKNEFSDSDLEARMLRSRLDRLVIGDQEYKFGYADGKAGVPDKSSLGIDHFGFYNGKDSNIRLRFADLSGTALCGSPEKARFYQTESRKPDFSYGIAGLLTRVEYPTKGYAEYEYGPHDYITRQKEVLSTGTPGKATAGGARIAGIRVYESDHSPISHKSYTYTSSFAPSSGLLIDPLYHFYYVEGSCGWTYQSGGSVPGHNNAQGKNIGYSRVIETTYGESASYKTFYDYQNFATQVEGDLVSNRNYTYSYFPGRNGFLLGETLKNSNSSVVTNQNTPYEASIGVIKGLKYQYHDVILGLIYTYYDLHQGFSGVKERVKYEFFSSGTLKTEVSYRYNDLFQLHSVTSSDSRRRSVETIYKRPIDYTAGGSTINLMKSPSVNMVDPVIETITRINGAVVASTANQYRQEHGNVVLSRQYVYNPDQPFNYSTNGESFTGGYEEVLHIIDYDASGNPLEALGRNGITNSYLWGYNNKLPIVHSSGATYSELSAAYSTSNGDENLLRSHSSTSKSLISSIEYNPLVGPQKRVDAGGVSSAYAYDNYGRLESVYDGDDHLRQHYQYNFKKGLAADITLSTTNIDFGIVMKDGEKTKSFTISNSGGSSFYVSSISMNHPRAFNTTESHFSASGWLSGLIPPGTDVEIFVTFSPTAYGEFNREIYITPVGTITLKGSSPSVLVRELILEEKEYSITSFGTAQIMIKNSAASNDNLVISNIKPANDPEDYKIYETYLVIPPGSRKFSTVQYINRYGFEGTRDILIFSNKTNNPGFDIVSLTHIK